MKNQNKSSEFYWKILDYHKIWRDIHWEDGKWNFSIIMNDEFAEFKIYKKKISFYSTITTIFLVDSSCCFFCVLYIPQRIQLLLNYLMIVSLHGFMIFQKNSFLFQTNSVNPSSHPTIKLMFLCWLCSSCLFVMIPKLNLNFWIISSSMAFSHWCLRKKEINLNIESWMYIQV